MKINLREKSPHLLRSNTRFYYPLKIKLKFLINNKVVKEMKNLNLKKL